MITASMLYDFVGCPHRVTQDLFGDSKRRDSVSPFVQLLWERGVAWEKEVIESLKTPFIDIGKLTEEDRQKATLDAMEKREPLIYGGRIQHDDLIGVPDLLRLDGQAYVPGDIKSGSGEEGSDDDSKPKKHYAVQLALYVDILEKLGKSAGRRAFIWDIHGKEVVYDLAVPLGVRNPRPLWDDYVACLAAVRQIVSKATSTTAAYSSPCKNCWWYSACLTDLTAANDLTLIPELGRSRREALAGEFPSIAALAGINPAAYVVKGKTKFAGIGPDSLDKFQRRAKLISTLGAKPYLRSPLSLPKADIEIFFDIEVDPMREICYLHGFLERDAKGKEKYFAFFAELPTEKDERAAFEAAWKYIQSRADAILYYYSKYERTIYRKLQAKHSDVCTAEAVEKVFDPARAVDLYGDVVTRVTEWPTRDYSLKTLAAFLGFKWRDTHPSGAASIEWFDQWVKARDPAVRQRIVEYNEDDCRATRVLLDGVRAF